MSEDTDTTQAREGSTRVQKWQKLVVVATSVGALAAAVINIGTVINWVGGASIQKVGNAGILAADPRETRLKEEFSNFRTYLKNFDIPNLETDFKRLKQKTYPRDSIRNQLILPENSQILARLRASGDPEVKDFLNTMDVGQ